MNRPGIAAVLMMAVAMSIGVSLANPDLQVGVWTELTPPGSLGATGVYHLGLAPSDPSIIYVSSDRCGMWKTYDGGENWERLGNPDGVNTADLNEYLDDPCMVLVDPEDPDHVVACEGVDGGRDGFWISRDGGDTWTMPQGFRDVGAIVGGAYFDVVMMSIDPADFDRIIVSTHSDWEITAGYSSGCYSTSDGGVTWSYHLPPGDAWAAGTKGIHILHDPASGQGNADTWLICDEGAGFWRTSDAGQNWTKVSDMNSPHGGSQSYYGSDGTLYVGARTTVAYSTDNGITWAGIQGMDHSAYMAVQGTGTTIFTQGTQFDCGGYINLFTSDETDGRNWSGTMDGIPPVSSWEMRFDPINRILYTVQRCGGLWALKVDDQHPTSLADSHELSIARQAPEVKGVQLMAKGILRSFVPEGLDVTNFLGKKVDSRRAGSQLLIVR